MPDKFFLLYANNLFKDDPKNLKMVFQGFIEQRKNMYKIHGIYNEWEGVQLEYLAETIDVFSNCSDFDSALKLKDKIKSKAQLEKKSRDLKNAFLKDHDNYVDVAFEAVFFYKTGWCHGTWPENGSCIGYQSDRHDFCLDDKIRLKCHECRQLFFRGMLMDFVSNEGFLVMDLKKINDYPFASLLDETWVNENFPGVDSVIALDSGNPASFDHYVSEAYNCVEIRAHTMTNKHIVKEELFALTNLFNDELSIYPVYTRFNDYFISIVSHSLVEFLRKNDLNKLKLCPFCNNFYIADDIRQKKCKSDYCKRVYEREKKRKQREEKPDIYC